MDRAMQRPNFVCATAFRRGLDSRSRPSSEPGMRPLDPGDPPATLRAGLRPSAAAPSGRGSGSSALGSSSPAPVAAAPARGSGIPWRRTRPREVSTQLGAVLAALAPGSSPLLPPPQAGLGVLVSVSREAFVVLFAGKLLLQKLGNGGPAAPRVGSVRPPPSARRPGPRSPGIEMSEEVSLAETWCPWARHPPASGPQQGALAPLQLTPTQACLPHRQGSHRPCPSIGIRVPLPAALAVSDTATC